MSKKNLVLFIRSLGLGGAEKQSLLLAKELSKDYNVTILVLYKIETQLDCNVNDNFDIIYASGNILSKSLFVFRFLKRNNTDILFNYLPVNNILGGIAGKISGVKKIVNGIRGSKTNKNLFKMKAQKFIGNYIVDLIVSNSHKGKASYSEYGFKQQKIRVIPNMISNSFKMESKNANQSNTINILTVARFVPEKDFETLFKSIDRLNTLHNLKHVRFTIVGYGKLDKVLREWILQYRLEKIVHIIDGRDTIDNQYETAHIYISTSKYEGMSNTIMEAMSYGLPVVATKAGDAEYLVEDKFNGFLCDIGNHEMISEKLYTLITNKKEREFYGQNSYKKINKEYSSKRIGDLYRELIEDL